MRWSINLLLFAATIASASPVDFGLAELQSALASRNLKWKVKTELSLDPPENYRIEPYTAGGARVTGGDLRGLMYGLLEAAEQVRETGRLKPVHGVPFSPTRAIRVVVHNSDDEKMGFDSEDGWRAAFQVLARNRFNRINLVFTTAAPELAPPYKTLRFISQAAADYGIDFALGLWDPAVLGPDSQEALSKLIAACPMIRSVQIRDSAPPTDVFRALHDAGRRVTLDPRGDALAPPVLKAAQDAGVALHRSPLPWPPSFEIDPPLVEDRWDSARYPLFYWLWGRVGYDAKIKPPKGADPAEFAAAIRARNQLAIAQLDVSAGDWGFVASIPEAVRNRLDRAASAKQTPLETADLLESAATALDRSAIPDFHLLASLARAEMQKLRAAYDAELSLQTTQKIEIPPLPRLVPRPQLEHKPPPSAPPEQPLELTLHVTPPKDVSAVRIYYRSLDRAAIFKMIEQPASAAVAFTIPASDLTTDGDLLYYFEVLNRERSGWFEPDPFTTPFHVVRIFKPEPVVP